MPSLFPSYTALQQAFSDQQSASAADKRTATPHQARSELYVAYSVVDDAKDKAKKLSAEAQKEFDKAKGAVKAKSGTKMELYSGSYYAACTFGGLMACVSPMPRSSADHAEDPLGLHFPITTKPLPR